MRPPPNFEKNAEQKCSASKFGSTPVSRPETKDYKTFSEIIHWYFRYYGKTKILCRGRKPDLIQQNKVPTQREWRKYEFLLNKKNVVLEGYAYLRFIENSVKGTYVEAGKVFGVYPERIRQKVMLVKRLPKEILDFLAQQTDPKILAYFTERRLRPLTRLKTDEEKMERFRGMVKELTRAEGNSNSFTLYRRGK